MASTHPPPAIRAYIEAGAVRLDISDLFIAHFELIDGLRGNLEAMLSQESVTSPRGLAAQAIDLLRQTLDNLTSHSLDLAKRVNLATDEQTHRCYGITNGQSPKAAAPIAVEDILAIKRLAATCRRPTVARQILFILRATTSGWTPTHLGILADVDAASISTTLAELARKGAVIGRWLPSRSQTPRKHRPAHGRYRDYTLSQNWKYAAEDVTQEDNVDNARHF